MSKEVPWDAAESRSSTPNEANVGNNSNDDDDTCDVNDDDCNGIDDDCDDCTAIDDDCDDCDACGVCDCDIECVG